MPRLEYTGGPNPFKDIKRFEEKVRKAHPGISDLGVQQVIKKAVGLRDPRRPNRTIALFGRDIMSEDVERLPIWPHLARSHRERILAHPIVGGEKVDAEQAKVSRLELIGRLDRSAVNRSVLVSPRGLERTYVWSTSTNWVQEVTENDYELILRDFGLRHLFTDPERHGPHVEVRSYDTGIVAHRYVARDTNDIKALIREHTRRPLVSGVDLKE